MDSLGSMISSSLKSGGLDIATSYLGSYFGAARTNPDINDYDKMTAAYEKLQKVQGHGSARPKMSATDLLLRGTVKPKVNIPTSAPDMTDLLVRSPVIKPTLTSTVGKVVTSVANTSTQASASATSALNASTTSASATSALSSSAGSAATNLVKALGGGGVKVAQNLKDPRYLAIVGAIALIWALIKSERSLRNINIKVIATDTPTVYTVGLGQPDHERRFSFSVQSGKPISSSAEPGIDLDKAYFVNHKDSSNVQSSYSFSTLFGLLSLFRFKRSEYTTVINIFVTDPKNPAFLKDNPEKIKGSLSQGEYVQVLQVRGKDRLFERFKQSVLPGAKSNHDQPDRIQRIFFSANEPGFKKIEGNTSEKVINLPEFNGSEEFLRIRVHQKIATPASAS